MSVVRKRYAAVALGLVGLISASALVACGSSDGVQQASDYTEICQDRDTGERVDDSHCNDHDHYPHSSWYYLPPSVYFIPSVGTRIGGGSYDRPASSYPLRRNVPSSGYSVPRPSFDNSKMKPVPGDFQPPTAPATAPASVPTQQATAPTKAPAPAVTQKAAPAPSKAAPVKVPDTTKTAPKVPTTTKK